MPSFRKWPWLEIALMLSLVCLIMLIFEQEIVRWWHLPSPGKVGIGCLDEGFRDSCLSESYLVGLPASYPEETSWPLLVFLHGSGERGYDPQKLRKFTDLLTSKRDNELPAVLVLPQCRPECNWQANDIRRLVEVVGQQYSVDSDRVYMVGNSMGGFGAWQAAAKCPDLFAAIAPIAGGGSVELAESLVNVPIWAFHGSMDDVVAVERTTDLVEAVRLAGGAPKLTLYPDEGHRIVDEVLRTAELWEWLFEQNLQKRRQMATASSNMDQEP